MNQKETITSVKPHLLKTKIINLELLRIRRLPNIKVEKSEELKKNEYILRNILRPELSFYDYIIMDCPPHLKGTMIPIVLAGFSIAVVSRMIAQSDFIRKKYNNDLKIAGIFFTIFEKDNETAAAIKKELTEIYEQYILNTLIPKSSVVREAFNIKKPVVVYNPEDEAAKAYRQLAKELTGKKFFKIELLH